MMPRSSSSSAAAPAAAPGKECTSSESTSNNSNNNDLPAHALHMRNALRDCHQGVEELRCLVEPMESFDSRFQERGSSRRRRPIFQSAREAAENHQKERCNGLKQFHQKIKSSDINTSKNSHSQTNGSRLDVVDVVHMHPDGISWCNNYSSRSPLFPCLTSTEARDSQQKIIMKDNTTKMQSMQQFKREYCIRNVPCLIRGLDSTHFKQVSSQWRQSFDQNTNGSILDENDDNANSITTATTTTTTANTRPATANPTADKIATKINTDWFRTFIGNDTLVPVRINNNKTDTNTNTEKQDDNDDDDDANADNDLDEEGRAQECHILEMTLSEWIDKCREHEERCNRFHPNHHYNYDQHHEQRNKQHDELHALHSSSSGNSSIGYYLKDWHLNQFLSEKYKHRACKKTTNDTGSANATTYTHDITTSTQSPSQSSRSPFQTSSPLPNSPTPSSPTTQQPTPTPTLPLYTTPPIFQHDLLNNFLQRYSDGGDYKFVYWGPTGSQTTLHSDVLHSFSWSYNVVGRKKWIFHVPLLPDEDDINNNNYDDDHYGKDDTNSNSKNKDKICKPIPKTFEVIQNTGEAIFVPSTWKHEVINLVETISINHNWITCANVDLTWQCLLTEISSIEIELQSWGIFPEDDFNARENMLRGCIGLDVTSFFFMVLVELVRLMLIVIHEDVGDDSVDDGEVVERLDAPDNDTVWDHVYSIFRLRSVVQSMLGNPASKSDCEVNLEQRLAAVLDSQEFAGDALSHVMFLLALTDYFGEEYQRDPV